MILEEVEEILGEVDEALENENGEGLDPSEAEELDAEIEAAQEGTSKLDKVVKGLKKLGDLTLDFTKFVVKTVAIGGIFHGVTVGLKKLTALAGGDAGTKQKYTKIKAISEFIRSSSELSKAVSDWLDAHKDDMIKLDGMDVPIVAIFVKYTNPLGDVSAQFMCDIYIYTCIQTVHDAQRCFSDPYTVECSKDSLKHSLDRCTCACVLHGGWCIINALVGYQ